MDDFLIKKKIGYFLMKHSLLGVMLSEDIMFFYSSLEL